MSDPARISPGGRRELGLLNWTISRFAARSIRAPEMHLFTTLGRHRLLFRSFLPSLAGHYDTVAAILTTLRVPLDFPD